MGQKGGRTGRLRPSLGSQFSVGFHSVFAHRAFAAAGYCRTPWCCRRPVQGARSCNYTHSVTTAFKNVDAVLLVHASPCPRSLPCPSSQAVGRCIRHKYDYGAIILFDERFSQPRNQAQLSRWVRGNIKVGVATAACSTRSRRSLSLCVSCPTCQAAHPAHWGLQLAHAPREGNASGLAGSACSAPCFFLWRWYKGGREGTRKTWQQLCSTLPAQEKKPCVPHRQACQSPRSTLVPKAPILPCSPHEMERARAGV